MFKSLKYLLGAGLIAGATTASAAGLPAECMPDYHRFCHGVPPGGGQIASCLAGRMEALAPECQRAISANSPYANPGRERYGYNVPPAPAPYGGYGGSAPYGGAYRYGARPNEDLPYPDEGMNRDRSEEDGYGDQQYGDQQNDRYAERPYGGGEYSDRGYSDAPEQQPGSGYQQPGPNYPPAEEGREALK